MSAPYGSPRSAGRRPVTASATAASPTGSGWSDGTRPEPKRPPTISTVAGCSRRKGSAPLVRGRVAGRLPEAHAVAAIGHDPIEDGRRPLAARDDPDDRRVRQTEGG